MSTSRQKMWVSPCAREILVKPSGRTELRGTRRGLSELELFTTSGVMFNRNSTEEVQAIQQERNFKQQG